MERLTYEEITEYLLSVPKFAGKHSIEDTRAFFEYMGSPCADARIIHVAGTNGKGSVCAYMRGVLERMGYHTALFVSPHLVSIRERFLFDGEMVSKEQFVGAFTTVTEDLFRYARSAEARTLDGLRKLAYHPSFFEFLFFLFLRMDAAQSADYMILETGLGGRLDATNIMPHKKVCVITKIGLDHTEYLGDTVAQIAAEKAGILRKGTPLVCLGDDKSSAAVLKECAERAGAPVSFVESCDFKIAGITDKSIAFSFHSVYYNCISMRLFTTACYQAENAALALRAVEMLHLEPKPEPAAFQEGIAAARWEARMEEIAPDVYLDGAHNEDGIRALLDTVSRTDPGRKNALVFAVVRDKRYQQMAALIARSGVFEKVYATSVGGSRALGARELADVLQTYGQAHCEVCDFPQEAYERSIREREEAQRIYIAGSLYLAGQIKAHLGRNSDD